MAPTPVGSARPRPYAWLAFLLLALALCAMYPFVGSPGTRALALAVLSLAVAVAVAVGLWLYRPSRWRPWLLLGVSQLLWFVAGTQWAEAILRTGSPPAADAPLHVMYLLGNAFFVAALATLLLAREGRAAAVLDAAIIAAAAGSVSWAVAGHRYLDAAFLSDAGALVMISYSILDLLVIGLVARLVVRGDSDVPFVLLALSSVSLLFSDVVWNWLTVVGSYVPGSWGDLGWLLFPVFLCMAALHPAMRRTFERTAATGREGFRGPLSLLALAGAVPVVVALVIADDGDRAKQLGIAAATGLVLLLVLVRLGLLLRESEASAALLRAANDRLLELDRMKDDFVASVSHELRTPLTSIRGYTELLAEGDAGELTSEQGDYLSVIDRNSGRLLALVSDLLDISAVQSGRFTLETAVADVGPIVRDSVARACPTAQARGIALTVDAEDVDADVDSSRLAQVLDNLISNAVKFTDRGGRVVVRLRVERGIVAIDVQDDGPGIADDDLPYVFDRFFRSRSASEAAVEGSGLGLAIAAAIVEAHGGTISVESRPGEGSTFRVRLPGARPRRRVPTREIVAARGEERLVSSSSRRSTPTSVVSPPAGSAPPAALVGGRAEDHVAEAEGA